MKIAHMEIMPVSMPKEDPEWRFALGADPQARGVILKLTGDNGLIGLGYTGVEGHLGSTMRAVQAALETYGTCLIEEDPFNRGKIFHSLGRLLAGNNEARAAIDIALYDLQAKALGLPVYALLGGLVREEIPVMRILALKEPVPMAMNAAKLVEQGYSYIKIKLGGEPAKDVRRVKEIRQAVGEKIHLTVDANQTYPPKVAIDTLKHMEEDGIELCEQPVRADDWEGLAAVTRAVDCLVEAHESAQSLEEVFGLVKDRVADCINLKVWQLGGLRNAQIAAAICRLGNVACRVSTTGSRLIAAASLHLVAATENVSYACELGEFTRLLNDPVEGLEVNQGILKVPAGPGLGVSLRT